MKVCLNTYYPLRSVSGVSRVVRQLALGLGDRGIDNFVVSGRITDGLELDSEINAVEIDLSKRKHLRDLYLAQRTFSILYRRRKEYDIIHSHSPHLSPMMAAVAGRMAGKPVITTIHGIFPKPKNRLTGALFKFSSKVTLSLSDVVTFVSQEAREQFKFPKGIVIENGVDAGHFSPDEVVERETRVRLGLSDGDIVFLYVGRLTEDKGIFDLLDAFSRAKGQVMKPMKLLFVGEGETQPIRSRAVELGIGADVLILGVQTDVLPYYRASDVLVLYSPHEGLPMVLLEAASCGLAIVSTGVGGIPSMITDNENGLLLEYGDTAIFTGKLKSLAEDDSLRKKLGENARNTVVERYALQRTINRYVELYKKLTSGGEI